MGKSKCTYTKSTLYIQNKIKIVSFFSKSYATAVKEIY